MDTRETHEMKIWQDPQLRSYLGEVRRKCGVVETLALPSLRDLPAIKIETLFVPPLLCATQVNADDDPEEWPAGRNLFSELQEFRQIVVLGDPGGGKTTLSNWLAWRLASGSSAPLPSVLENKIPFPCILREMSVECFERGFSVADLAVAVVSKLVGSSKAEQLSGLVRRWVEEGNYVLILDGIDEVSVSRRQLIASWIREANRQNAVVLATSRVVGYDDYTVDSESVSVEQSSGESSVNLDRPRISALKRPRISQFYTANSTSVRGGEWAKLRYLMPFNSIQIADFSRNWYSQRCVSELEAKQRASDLLTSLAQSEITAKLARTPNLLSLMAIVHRERAHLPDGKALLYDEIVNAYLNTIDSQRRIGEEITLAQFGWKEKKSWLAYIGFKLQESRDWSSSTAGILASEEQVIEWLEVAIKQTEIEDYKPVAKEFLSWVARRSGLLLPRGENRYAFVHLSFQEYFCAYYLADCIVKPAFVTNKIPSNSSVTKEKVSKWGQHPSWLETYIFLFESLSAEHGFDWVETLMEIVFASGGGVTLANLAARLVKNKHVKLPSEARDFLAVGCVSAVYSESDYKSSPDSEVFRILLEAGYAAYVSEDDTLEQFASGGLSATKVRVLVAADGAVLDADSLSGFKNLIALSAVDSSVDLVGLNRSTALNYLRLRDSDVSGFNEVQYFKNIVSLELRRVDVENLTPLASLKKLRVIEVAEIPVVDISPLGGLRDITYIEVSGLDVVDLSSLSLLTKIDTVYLSDLPATSVDFVGKLKRLEGISISNMSLSDFSLFSGCKKLESLDFTDMDFVDLTPFSGLPKLETVFLTDIRKVDVSPAGSMKSLGLFMVEKISIDDISVLSKCKRLLNVYLNKVDLGNFSSLAALKKLHALTLRSMPVVADLKFLRGFKQLEYLDLRETEVGDVSILDQMKAPFTLRISTNHNFDIGFLLAKEGFDIKIEELEIEED